MFKYIPRKINLIIPILILAIIFLTLTVSLVRIQFLKTKSLLLTENKIILATKLSKVLHELQRERGLSIGFISSNGINFKEELLQQREYTNNKIEELHLLLNNQNYIRLNELEETRESIDDLSTDSESILEYYSTINSKLLNEILEISKISKISTVTHHIIAYSNFLCFKEHSGIERAVGTNILSNKTLNYKKILQLNSLIIKERIYIKNFLKYASKNAINYYYTLCHGSVLNEISNMRKKILNTDYLHSSVDVKFWFNHLSYKINTLDSIDTYLSNEIILNIKSEINETEKNFYIVVFLNIGSLIIFIFMIGLILNLIQNDKKLKNLLDKYIIQSTTDKHGIIINTSEAFCKVSGYSKEELLGKSHSLVRHPDMPKRLYKEMWDVLKSGKVWSGNIKNLKKNGEYYWVNAQIEPIKNNSHEITSYVAIRHEITAKIKLDILNQQLEDRVKNEVKKNREKDNQIIQQSRLAQMGEMISMIAHQWRQPLAAISSTAGAIKLKATRNTLDNNLSLKLSNEILEYAQHLSTTIDDFREFFKSNKEKRDTNYNELIQGVLSIIEVSMRYQKIKLIQTLQCTDTFHTYSNELRQVILNLIKNAEDILIEKEIKNPYIEIATYRDNKKFILEVRDNAGGVPNEIIDKIFDPYFSTKTQKDGTGLGLYMSKTIIEEHCGGELTIHNDDKGAVFKISLM